MPRGARASAGTPKANAYEHRAQHPVRPDVGIQPEFQRSQRKSKPPVIYRFDQALDPRLSWDSNPVRGQGSERSCGLWAYQVVRDPAQTRDAIAAAAERLVSLGGVL